MITENTGENLVFIFLLLTYINNILSCVDETFLPDSLTGNKPDTSPKLHRMVPPFLLAKTDNTSANRSTRAGRC